MMTKSRLEAFSDGVIAIIITIMVLEIKVPEGHAWADILKLWPKFLGYILSFVYVGIYWNNHHHLFQIIRRVSGGILWSNLHLLFWLSLFPVVAAWAGESHFAPVPMTCYAFIAFMCAVAFTVLSLSLQAGERDNHLLAEAVGTGNKEKISLVIYALAMITPQFGQVGAWISGGLLLLAAFIWLVPDRRIEQQMERVTQQSTESGQ